MDFLVTNEAIDMGMMPPAQMAELMQTMVIPSLEMLKQAHDQGRIRGGGFAGQRRGVFIISAGSAEEVHEFLVSLPFWGINRWDVQPLISPDTSLNGVRGMQQRMGAAKPTGS